MVLMLKVVKVDLRRAGALLCKVYLVLTSPFDCIFDPIHLLPLSLQIHLRGKIKLAKNGC